MPTLGQRMFKLKELLSIRIGPGAAVLPKDVKRITMRIAPKIDDGHRGPKRFFRHILPRLKYRNPALPITVDRKAAQTDPAVMNIIFSESGSTATTSTSDAAATSAPSAGSSSSSNDRVVTIQMKHKTESEILQLLYEATGAKEIEPTDVEREELRELQERKERGRRDSERMAEVNRQKKREAQMLAAARGEIPVNAA